MAGCYGNSPFDRYWEGRLFEYLNEEEEDQDREDDQEYELENDK